MSLLERLIVKIIILIHSPLIIAEAIMDLPDSSGIHDIKIETSVGVVDVTLSVPKVLDDQPRPLVLVLHYAGQPTSFYGRPLIEFLVEPSFAHMDPILFAPTSLGGDWKQAHNVTAVLELIELFSGRYPVDEKRRIITGYSMGAIGSWYLSTQHPNLFSAALPVAGFPVPLPSCVIPTHVILSRADEVFPIAKFLQEIEQRHDNNLQYSLIERAGHYDISAFMEPLKKAIESMRE